MKTGLLISVPPTDRSARVKLTAFKRSHNIRTWRAKHLRREDEPWLAVIPFSGDENKSIGQLMADSCRLYEEAGYCATGAGELSAIRRLCEQRGIVFDLK